MKIKLKLLKIILIFVIICLSLHSYNKYGQITDSFL